MTPQPNPNQNTFESKEQAAHKNPTKIAKKDTKTQRATRGKLMQP
jgi:hypothetical protein